MCSFGAFFTLAAAPDFALQEVEMWQLRFLDASSFSTKEVHAYFEYSGSKDPRPLVLSATCEFPGNHVLQFPKDPRHPAFKIRFVLPAPEAVGPEAGHEIGGCELDLMDLNEDGEPMIKAMDVQDSTDAVIGFVEIEVSSYTAKVDDDDGPLRANGVLLC